MCITSADIIGEEESLVWDIFCHECTAKAEKLLDKREAPRLLDISMEVYNFCSECMGRINERFDEAYECMDDMKDGDDHKFRRSKN